MMTLVIRGVLGVVNRIMPALSYNFHSNKPCGCSVHPRLHRPHEPPPPPYSYALGPMMGAAQAIRIEPYSLAAGSAPQLR
jgi:hypothetical protein